MSTVPTSEISTTSFQITSTTFVDTQANTVHDTSDQSSSKISTSILTSSSDSNSTTVLTEFSTSGSTTTTASTLTSGHPTTTAALISKIVSSTPIISTTYSHKSEISTSETSSEQNTIASTSINFFFSDTTFSKLHQIDSTPVKPETQKTETIKNSIKPQPAGYGGKDFLYAALKAGQAKQADDSRFTSSVGGLNTESPTIEDLMMNDTYDAHIRAEQAKQNADSSYHHSTESLKSASSGTESLGKKPMNMAVVGTDNVAKNGEETRKTPDSGYTHSAESLESDQSAAESPRQDSLKSADEIGSQLITKTAENTINDFTDGNRKLTNTSPPEPSNQNPNSNIDSIFSKTNGSKIGQGKVPVNSTDSKNFNQLNTNSLFGRKDVNSNMLGNSSKNQQNGIFKQGTQNGKQNATSNNFVDKFGNIMKAEASISKKPALDVQKMSTKSDSNLKQHFSSKQEPKFEPMKPYDKNNMYSTADPFNYPTFKKDDSVKIDNNVNQNVAPFDSKQTKNDDMTANYNKNKDNDTSNNIFNKAFLNKLQQNTNDSISTATNGPYDLKNVKFSEAYNNSVTEQNLQPVINQTAISDKRNLDKDIDSVNKKITNNNMSNQINPYVTKKISKNTENQTGGTINKEYEKKNNITNIFNQGRKIGHIQNHIKQAMAKTDSSKTDSGQQKNRNGQNSSDQNKGNQNDKNQKSQGQDLLGKSVNSSHPNDYQEETDDSNQISDYTPYDFSNVFASNQIIKDQSINSNQSNENGSALDIMSTIPFSLEPSDYVTNSTASTVTSNSTAYNNKISNLVSKPGSPTDSTENMDKQQPKSIDFSPASFDLMKTSRKSSEMTNSGPGDDNNNRSDISDEQFKSKYNTDSNSLKDATSSDRSDWDAKAKMAGQNKHVTESTSTLLNEINKYTANQGMIAADSADSNGIASNKVAASDVSNGSNSGNDAGGKILDKNTHDGSHDATKTPDNGAADGSPESDEAGSTSADALLKALKAQQKNPSNDGKQQISSTFSNLDNIEQSTNKLANDLLNSNFPNVNKEMNPMNDLDKQNKDDIGVGFSSNGSNTSTYSTVVQENENNETTVNGGVQSQNLDDQLNKSTSISTLQTSVAVEQSEQFNRSSTFTSVVTGNPKYSIVEGGYNVFDFMLKGKYFGMFRKLHQHQRYGL